MRSNADFAELLSYMQEVMDSIEATPVFQLSALIYLCTSMAYQLAEHRKERVHATRFKNRMLGYFPELEAYSEGRDILLVPRGAAGVSIRKTCQLNVDTDTVIMSRVADIIRRDMFINE